MPESSEARERRLSRAREWKRRHADKHAANVREYRRKYPQKVKAQNAVAYAVSNGTLVKGPCESCGTTQDICAHHSDYLKPLEVEWLCRPCHIRHHKPQLWRGVRGGNTSVSKLNQESVIRIRKLLSTGLLTNKEISKIFDVTPENISAIRDGKTWKYIEDGLTIPRGIRGAPALSSELIEQVRQLTEKGYTQAETSRELDISTASVSRILHGRK